MPNLSFFSFCLCVTWGDKTFGLVLCWVTPKGVWKHTTGRAKDWDSLLQRSYSAQSTDATKVTKLRSLPSLQNVSAIHEFSIT